MPYRDVEMQITIKISDDLVKTIALTDKTVDAEAVARKAAQDYIKDCCEQAVLIRGPDIAQFHPSVPAPQFVLRDSLNEYEMDQIGGSVMRPHTTFLIVETANE